MTITVRYPELVGRGATCGATLGPFKGRSLAVIPDAGRFVLFPEQERVIPVLKHFLEKTEKRSLATAGMGINPAKPDNPEMER